ncbi:MAG: hypothetical protein GC152_09380 [Alphaproteobacteria bacterium]|nr:hypothetical protein [Alphaproteobacteria bacterium]
MGWTEGYQSETDYVLGYFPELSPNLIRFGMTLSGYAPPPDGPYLELGFGLGLSLNLHAASNPGEFWGTDFLPWHVAEARLLGAASGARLLDDSFEELAERQDLPQFSWMTAHGVYSWIDPRQRSVLRGLYRDRLTPGAAVYLSYNTMPGWAETAPVQRFLRFYVENMSSLSDPLVARLKEAFGLINLMRTAKAGAFENRPLLLTRLERAESSDFAYLAHEYINTSWDPLYFSDVAHEMSEAKLRFACGSNPMEAIPALSEPPAIKEILATIGDATMRHQMIDYAVNRGFRKDIFVRGGRRLPEAEYRSRVLALRITNASMSDPEAWEFDGPMGKVQLHENHYAPALDVLRRASRPMTLRDLGAATQKDFNTIKEVAASLVGAGLAHACHEEDATSAVRKKCAALNKVIRERAAIDGQIQFLASPVTGTGIRVSRFEQFFISAIEARQDGPAALAKHAFAQLQSVGHAAVVDGTVLKTEAENLEYFTGQARTFLDKRLPLLKRLGIA